MSYTIDVVKASNIYGEKWMARRNEALIKAIRYAVLHLKAWMEECRDISLHRDYLSSALNLLENEYNEFINKNKMTHKDRQFGTKFSKKELIEKWNLLSEHVDNILNTMKQKETSNVKNNFNVGLSNLKNKFPKLAHGQLKLNKLKEKQQKEIEKNKLKIKRLRDEMQKSGSASSHASHKIIKQLNKISQLEFVHQSDVCRLKKDYKIDRYENAYSQLLGLKKLALNEINSSYRDRKSLLERFFKVPESKDVTKINAHTMFADGKQKDSSDKSKTKARVSHSDNHPARNEKKLKSKK